MHTFNVEYFRDFYNQEEADKIFDELKQLSFQSHTVTVCGKKYTPRRRICAYGDAGTSYSFSGITIPAQPWTPTLAKIKEDVEVKVGYQFNFVLLNLYEDGRAGIGTHRDDEKELQAGAPIPTLSFGTTRKFIFKKKNFSDVEYTPHHGSLLIMISPTNQYWTHEIPKQLEVTEARISLTFRNIVTTSVKRPLEIINSVRPSASTKMCEELPVGDWLEKSVKSGDILCDTSPSKKQRTNAKESGIVSYPTHNFPVPKEEIFKQDLGNELFLCVDLYSENVKIHIRQFKINMIGNLFPSREGVCMDLNTWYDFCLKVVKFNMYYASSSFIANNNLLTLSTKSNIHLQRMTLTDTIQLNYNFVKLSGFQFENLLNCIDMCNEKIVNYMCSTYIINLIKCEQLTITDAIIDEESILYSKLLKCIENELSKVFKIAYYCWGCSNNEIEDYQHMCRLLSSFEKYDSLGTKVFMLIDFKSLVKSFVEEVDSVSLQFLDSISVDSIKEKLYIMDV